MISNQILEELRCSLSDDRHFMIDPIPLSKCGHSACKNCLPKKKFNSVKCKTCGVTTTDEDFSKINVSRGLQQTLKLCLGNIFELIESQTVSLLNKFKSILKIKIKLIVC
jgi:hypothetical protein